MRTFEPFANVSPQCVPRANVSAVIERDSDPVVGVTRETGCVCADGRARVRVVHVERAGRGERDLDLVEDRRGGRIID